MSSSKYLLRTGMTGKELGAEIYQIELLTKSNEERRREPLEYYKL